MTNIYLKGIRRKTVAVFLVLLLLVSYFPLNASEAAINTTLMGFRASEGGGGKLDLGYTTGNLGNTWAEGEWVPYQFVLTGVQSEYPGLEGFPGLEISYDFTRSGARFIDLVRAIQVGDTELTDLQGWPDDLGVPYPMTTRDEIEDAQKDRFNNLDLENQWPGFELVKNLSSFNYESQINLALGGGIGTATDSDKKFIVTTDNLIEAGLGDSDTIVLYFQLHESRTFIWRNALQSGYDAYPTATWGGYAYSEPVFATDARDGASYVPGSSGHVTLLTISGAKTVPIPIPPEPEGDISGHKYLDVNNNGEIDPGDTPLEGWAITVSGTVENIYFERTELTDADGFYRFPSVTAGNDWLIEETLQPGYFQTYPNGGTPSMGDTYPLLINSLYGWDVLLQRENPIQENVDFANFLALPGLTIEKSGDELSKVGDEVTYYYTVTNTGNVDLDLVSVLDDVVGNITEEFSSSLAPGDSETVSVAYIVEQGDPDPLINTVEAIYDVTIIATQISAIDSWETNLFQPAISVGKTGTELSKIGDPVDYTITVSNDSSIDTPLMDFHIVDSMLGIDEYVTLGYEEEHVITVSDFIIPVDASDPYSNTVNVTASPDGFPNVLEASASWDTNLFQPSIEITKVGDELSKAGDSIDYIITVTNTSSPDTPSLIGNVVDPLLGLDAFVSLAPGGSIQFVETYDVPVDYAEDFVMNTATVTTSPDGFPNIIEASDSWETNLFQPSIEITKVGDELSKAGDSIDYIITVTNTSSPDTPNLIGNVVDPLLGLNEPVDLAPGDSIEFVATYDVPVDYAEDFVMNTATVTTSPDGFPNIIEASDSWETNLFQPSIEITKVGDELSKAGDSIDYIITVTNTSSPDTPNLIGNVVDPLLGLNEPVDLAPGDSIEFVATYDVPVDYAEDFVMNTATVTTSPDGFPNIIAASASWETNLFQPSIHVSKTGDEYSKVGDLVDYVIIVDNTSSMDTPVMEFTVTDTVAGVNEFFELASGESRTINVNDFVIPEGASDPFVNTVEVVASPIGFPNVYIASAIWETDLVHPSIDLQKSVDPTVAMVGDEVYYTITILNDGDIGLENIMVTDTVMGDITSYFNSTLDVGESNTAVIPYTILETDPEMLENIATVHANPIGLPNDITDFDSAVVEIIHYKDETAWGYDEGAAIPFMNIEDSNFNNWGWTNGPYHDLTPGSVIILELYADAGGNVISEENHVGYVEITYTGDNTFNVVYHTDYKMTEVHFYIGNEMLPMKDGKFANSPGQFPYGEKFTDGVYHYEMTVEFEQMGDFYIAAHAVVWVPMNFNK